MSIRERLGRWLLKGSPSVAPGIVPAPPRPKISELLEETPEGRRIRHAQAAVSLQAAIEASMADADGSSLPTVRTSIYSGLFSREAYAPPQGVAPEPHVARTMKAADMALTRMMSGNGSQVLVNGLGFPGFPFLSELSQMTEYRDMSDRLAGEMVRKWIKFAVKSQDGKGGSKEDRIAELEASMEKHDIKGKLRRCAVLDGYFGRSNLFIDLGDVDGPELEAPLMLNQYKVNKGMLRGFKVVEPITTYPAAYNSDKPLKQDYYVPSAWFVFGQKVHATRLLTFESRPLPELLKPVYNFSGISLSQLAMPYVDYWLSTRSSVGNLIRNFSTSVLKTNMANAISGAGGTTQAAAELMKRAKLFTIMRDNQGLFCLDNGTEDFEQFNVSLAGLSDLQAQAQEHMASVAKTPLVVLLGITPKGLNASSDGEIRVFYDYVAEQQEILFRHNLTTIVKVMMLDLWGEIDEDITFGFEPLYAMTEKEHALIRKSDAEAGQIYVQIGAVSAAEERERIASDPTSGYNSLDVDKLPPPPAPAEVEAAGGKVSKSGEAEENAQETNLMEQGGDALAKVAIDAMDGALRLAADSGFYGNQHAEVGGDDQTPYARAAKLSAEAQRLSSRARAVGSALSHKRALQAHQRALQAHATALQGAPAELVPCHEAFVQAHQAAIAAHAAGEGRHE